MPLDREKARIAALETGLRRIRDALPDIDDYDNYAETIAREVIAEVLEPIDVPLVPEAEAKLARIRALCDETRHLVGEPAAWLLADRIRAVLDGDSR